MSRIARIKNVCSIRVIREIRGQSGLIDASTNHPHLHGVGELFMARSEAYGPKLSGRTSYYF
jgi:hypothetical protein